VSFDLSKELDCEYMNSQLMALSLLTATTGTGSGIFIVIFFVPRDL
jgi:hypothetical protein